MGELHFPLCCAASSAMWLWAGKTKHKQDVMINKFCSSNCELGQMICEAGARRVARGVMGNSAIGGTADADADDLPVLSLSPLSCYAQRSPNFPAPILLHENKRSYGERSEGRKAG